MLKVEKIEFYEYLAGNITLIFLLQMDLFLIYLITRFTRPNQGQRMPDTVLGRDVPRIVFVNNQKMLKEAYINRLNAEDNLRADLRKRAEANEFLYYRMKEIGLMCRIDEEVGFHFSLLAKGSSSNS